MHSSKDLAVSPFDFAQGKPQVYTKYHPSQVVDSTSRRPFRMLAHFRLQASLFAPRGLLRVGVTHYPSPLFKGSVRTFLYRFCPPEVAQNRVPRASPKGDEGLSLAFSRDVQFCNHLRWTKLAATIRRTLLFILAQNEKIATGPPPRRLSAVAVKSFRLPRD